MDTTGSELLPLAWRTTASACLPEEPVMGNCILSVTVERPFRICVELDVEKLRARHSPQVNQPDP